MIGLRIDESGFVEKMDDILEQAKRPEAVLAAAGREGANQLRSHFLQKDRTNVNKLAPDRRQHLWQQIAHAVESPIVDAEGRKVTIFIHHPIIAQKIFGGTITAKRVQNLSIPESPEAYGRAPAVFEHETGLKLIFVKTGDHAVLAARINDGSKALQVEYLLTPSVHQNPDPTALPDMDKLKAAVVDRAQKVLDRQLEENS